MDGYLPLQDPPGADLTKAHQLLGYIKTVLSTSIDTQVGQETHAPSSRLKCQQVSAAAAVLEVRHIQCVCVCVQDERLLERDCAVWSLHGEPTVLITLAHIFNHFAPLMVRQAVCVH